MTAEETTMKSMVILSIVVVVFVNVSFADGGNVSFLEKCYNETNPAIQEGRERTKACDPDYSEDNPLEERIKSDIRCNLKPLGIVDANDQLDVEKFKENEGKLITNESKRPAIMAMLDTCANGTNTVDAVAYLNCFEEKIWEICPID